jgi:hypothetical protein
MPHDSPYIVVIPAWITIAGNLLFAMWKYAGPATRVSEIDHYES